MRGSQGRRRASAFVGAAICSSSIAIAMTASASPPSPPAADLAATTLTRSSARVLTYWTAERMRSALPLGARSASNPVSERPGALPGRTPSFVPPAAAGTPSRARLRRGRPGGAAASAFSPGAEGVFPNRVHGRVFFTVPEQGDFACSGTVVNSPGRSLVVTAGHCVYANGVWSTNFIFVPGYRDGNAPYGRWAAATLHSPPAWVNAENTSFDIGAAVIRHDGNGRALQDLVGGRGIGFDQARAQTYTSYGYPALPPFDGERLLACTSPYQGDDPSTDPPRTMAIDCDMNQGSSGGGWVAKGLVLSVNSYLSLFDLLNPRLYGPYFSSAARALYEQARGRAINCLERPVTNLGNGAANQLGGTTGRDSLSLGRGADIGAGLGGRDRLCGGPGDDILRAGPGFDVCDGGSGSDRASGCEVRKRIP